MFAAAAATERAFESVLTADQSRDLKATLNLLWRSDATAAGAHAADRSTR